MTNLDVIPYTDLAKNRRPLEDQLPLAMPLSLHIEVTGVCNFHCKSCCQYLPEYKDRAGAKDFMSMSLYEKIMRDVKEMGQLKALKLFGYGEPMLHPDLPAMVAMAKRMSVTERVEFASNCSRLTETVARNLIVARLDYLRVSIYGMDQQQHDDFTGRKYSIDAIRENVARLRRLRDADGSKYPFIYVKIFEGGSPDEEAEFHAKYDAIADQTEVECLHNMSGIGTERLGIAIPERPDRKICPLPFYQASVGANGDLTICCVDNRWSSKVGNLKDSSLKELWHSPQFNEYRRKMLTGRRCEIESCARCTWPWNAPDNLDDIGPEKVSQILKSYGVSK